MGVSVKPEQLPASWRGRTKRRLDQHRLIELLHVRRHAQGRHRVKDAERMASVEQLARVALVQRPERQQDDVVNHVGVAERGQGSGSFSAGSEISVRRAASGGRGTHVM